MPRLLVRGKRQPLSGTVKISGAKNAAVAIIPAALLAAAPVRIENLPDINDIRILVEIIEDLGVKVAWESPSTLLIDATTLQKVQAPYELVKKMRASYYLIGALVGRFGCAEVPIPGGCDLGPRPIDQHIKGLVSMGAKVEVEHGLVKVEGKRLQGTNIYLDIVSVGATINIMLAAVRSSGKTVIENAAKEPEIVDVANFLNAMGAHVRGAGTDVIKVTGVDELFSATHCVIPDRIEAGTYMIAAAASGGNVLLSDLIPKHTVRLKDYCLMERPVAQCKLCLGRSSSLPQSFNSRRALENEVACRRSAQQRTTIFIRAAAQQGEKLLATHLDRGATRRVALPPFVEIAVFCDVPLFQPGQVSFNSDARMDLPRVWCLAGIDAEKVVRRAADQRSSWRIQRSTADLEQLGRDMFSGTGNHRASST